MDWTDGTEICVEGRLGMSLGDSVGELGLGLW